MQNENPEKIVSEQLEKLQRQKHSKERLRFYLIAIYGSLIKSKIFKSNSDLRPFMDLLPTKIVVKDYLLKARPPVVARMVSELSDADEAALAQFVSVATNLVAGLSESERSKPEVNQKVPEDAERSHKKKPNYIDDLVNKYSRKSD